jgi:hypothetical protein
MTIFAKQDSARLNVLLVESINETISALLSRKVADALYVYLQKVHSIPKDEIVCKPEALCSVLEKTFGFPSSMTICRAIAKRLYAKLDLVFYDNPGRTLLQYLEEAEIKLGEGRC